MRCYPILLIPTLLILACGEDPVAPYNAGDVTGDYLPLSTGSVWSYSGYRSGGLVIERDTVIDGVAWVVQRVAAEEPTYLRRQGDTYYQRTPEGEENIILREQGVDMTWSNYSDDPSRNTRHRSSYQIISYDQGRIVNGKIYEDVMHLQVSYYTEREEETWDRDSLVARYYARGVGLIEEITLKGYDVLETRLDLSDVIDSDVKIGAAAEDGVDGGRASVMVEGEPWDVRRVSVDTVEKRIYLGSGYLTNGRSLDISLESLASGVYTFDSRNNGASYTWDIGRKVTGAPAGELEITTNTAQEIAGRFSMVMENGMAIEGTFVLDK